jgi:hypothetical protein
VQLAGQLGCCVRLSGGVFRHRPEGPPA